MSNPVITLNVGSNRQDSVNAEAGPTRGGGSARWPVDRGWHCVSGFPGHELPLVAA